MGPMREQTPLPQTIPPRVLGSGGLWPNRRAEGFEARRSSKGELSTQSFQALPSELPERPDQRRRRGLSACLGRGRGFASGVSKSKPRKLTRSPRGRARFAQGLLRDRGSRRQTLPREAPRALHMDFLGRPSNTCPAIIWRDFEVVFRTLVERAFPRKSRDRSIREAKQWQRSFPLAPGVPLEQQPRSTRYWPSPFCQ